MMIFLLCCAINKGRKKHSMGHRGSEHIYRYTWVIDVLDFDPLPTENSEGLFLKGAGGIFEFDSA